MTGHVCERVCVYWILVQISSALLLLDEMSQSAIQVEHRVPIISCFTLFYSAAEVLKSLTNLLTPRDYGREIMVAFI
jgi:hypothetical protein